MLQAIVSDVPVHVLHEGLRGERVLEHLDQGAVPGEEGCRCMRLAVGLPGPALQFSTVNRLQPDDLAGGTFTLSNLGFAGVDFFTPILRPPESGLLGVGRIIEKPVVRDGRVQPEKRIGLSLTFDHRVIDRAPAARFLQTVREMIEDPFLLIT